jgi:hypothetical protein
LEELDKDDAEYPRKISYHNPPNLALETLEVIATIAILGIPADNLHQFSISKIVKFFICLQTKVTAAISLLVRSDKCVQLKGYGNIFFYYFIWKKF